MADSGILKDYTSYLRIERAMSPNTVSAYSRDVAAFLEWYAASGSGLSAAGAGKSGWRSADTAPSGMKRLISVTSHDIISYLHSRAVPAASPGGKEPVSRSGTGLQVPHRLTGRLLPVSKRSQARILSSLRSFFVWMIQEGYMTDNPCDGVDTPKMGRYLPEVLSMEEVAAIMDAVPLTDWMGLRDRAILEMLYGCGLRVSEASGIRISDLFFDEGFVRVIGKGNKERIVPIGEMAMDAVRNYMDVRPVPSFPVSRPSSAQPSCRADDILFLNSRGTRLSRVSIFNMVKHYAMLAGITKEISPHTFRHSFATHLIENGADLRIVQEMLGHESILTTEIYTHIDRATWQTSVLSHHPRR